MRNKAKTGPKQRTDQAFLNWARSCHAQHAGLTTQIKRVDRHSWLCLIQFRLWRSTWWIVVSIMHSQAQRHGQKKKAKLSAIFFSVAVNVLASIFYARRVNATGNNFPLFRCWLVFARRVNTSPAQLYQMGWRCFPTTDIFLTICMSVSSSHDTSTRPTAFGKQFNDLQHATCNIKYHQEEGIQQDKSGILPRMNGVRWDVKYMVG